MPRPTAGSARPPAQTSKLAQTYRRFAQVDAPKISPLYERIALALSESPEALHAIETAPTRKQTPLLILAALHHLALTNQSPPLTTAYQAAATSAAAASVAVTSVAVTSAAAATSDEPATTAPPPAAASDKALASPTAAGPDKASPAAGSGEAAPTAVVAAGSDTTASRGVPEHMDLAVEAAVRAVVEMKDAVVAVVGQRKVRANVLGNHAVLYPAIAEVARRAGIGAVGLIDVGCAAGFNLNVDRAGINYDNAQSLGDPSSPVQAAASVVGERAVPTNALPEVVVRIGIDLEPIDTRDPDEAGWLRACVPPDQPDRMARLEGELELAASAPPFLMRGDKVELLPDAIAQVPADALPVVTTTWALSDLPLESRLRCMQRLDAAATNRPVAWVSVEGVGVAPAIPTFGDRPASGHSIIGLALFDHSTLHTEAVGRCWLRGQMLAWLADS
ncbi:DUF2332 domain-containing protein [Kribbella sp. NPDC000426]|uniref:DUF2332 domain-containing protein n=1 Tax=Kribbella sp. NPDC000426 TaxID=3154255 RepID=UPI00333117E9